MSACSWASRDASIYLILNFTASTSNIFGYNNFLSDEMGIIPSSRGYVAGDLKFRFMGNDMSMDDDNSSGWTNAMPNENDACALPISASWSDLGKEVDIQSDAKFIVVIEKEGVFRRYDTTSSTYKLRVGSNYKLFLIYS
jgi:DNA topoisomerase VI subunit A